MNPIEKTKTLETQLQKAWLQLLEKRWQQSKDELEALKKPEELPLVDFPIEGNFLRRWLRQFMGTWLGRLLFIRRIRQEEKRKRQEEAAQATLAANEKEDMEARVDWNKKILGIAERTNLSLKTFSPGLVVEDGVDEVWQRTGSQEAQGSWEWHRKKETQEYPMDAGRHVEYTGVILSVDVLDYGELLQNAKLEKEIKLTAMDVVAGYLYLKRSQANVVVRMKLPANEPSLAKGVNA